MIRGYPARPSVAPGERLVLHVATDAPRFRVAFWRWADGFEPLHETGWRPGANAPDGRPDGDWRWPAFAFDVPPDWPSGVVVAHLVESAAPAPLAPAMTSAAALFVVRSRLPRPIVYKLPFATFHAYNAAGGGCFYVDPPRSADPPGAKVSWRRPGGGIGGPTHGAADAYDPGSPRQTFAHWDARFIRWLVREGFGERLAFCADLDLHDDAGVLDGARLLLSVGHDEYWSEPMRDAVEGFVARGGNAAFFAANLCWWRIHLVDGATAMVCHQGGPQGARDAWWPAHGARRPEDGLAGVSYRHGGGWWDGPREPTPFVVQRDHWAFAGTGLAAGDAFGARSTPPLVGYECDGAPLAWRDAARGRVALAPEAAACGTPPGFVPLAVGVLGPGWQELPARERHGARAGLHSATLGIREGPGGSVFTAGTTDWAQVLDNGSDAAVPAITRNVVARLSGAPAPAGGGSGRSCR